jgi:hypothetical protein
MSLRGIEKRSFKYAWVLWKFETTKYDCTVIDAPEHGIHYEHYHLLIMLFLPFFFFESELLLSLIPQPAVLKPVFPKIVDP